MAGRGVIKILGSSYHITDIAPGLRRKLVAAFPGVDVKAKEITDDISLITNLIGSYVVKRLAGHAKFYVINTATQKVKTILERKLGDNPEKTITVGDVFRKLEANGIKVFLKGGIIRDIFMSVDSVDVDAVFDSDINKIKTIGDAEGWIVDNMVQKYQAVNIGGAKGVSIDLVNLKATFMSSEVEHEFTVNDLVFDWRANVLIDLSGYGLPDVLNRVIRISPTPNLYQKWAYNDWKKPLRYFKLIMKGFTPMTPKLHKFIVDYITNNLDNVYFAPLYHNISRLKHYLIKNITNGTINPDGSYEYGVNKRAIAPYLLTMKKYLGSVAFTRIVNILRADSRDKYLTRVATRVSAKVVMSSHVASIKKTRKTIPT